MPIINIEKLIRQLQEEKGMTLDEANSEVQRIIDAEHNRVRTERQHLAGIPMRDDRRRRPRPTPGQPEPEEERQKSCGEEENIPDNKQSAISRFFSKLFGK